MDLRLCFTELQPVFSIKEPVIPMFGGHSFHTNIRPVFTGTGRKALNAIVDLMFKTREGMNYTFVKESGFGQKSANGEVTGCLGSMARNESDFAAVPIDFPTGLD